MQAIARLHVDHVARATRLQRLVDRLTARAGRPAFVALLTAIVVVWIALNLGLAEVGHKPIHGPPFVAL